jgi:hypothetical protein
MLIHRIIREAHIGSLLDGFLYFAPCNQFVDLLEFRFACCRDQFELGQDYFERCIQKSFGDENIQRRIKQTSILCWTTHPREMLFTWEVYGKSAPAIRLTVDSAALDAHVRIYKPEITSSGPVTYHFATSLVRPQFLSPPTQSDSKKAFDLFFHKDGFYSYESEFRVVVSEKGPVMIPVPTELINLVTLSPVGFLTGETVEALQEKFGERVQASAIRLPY